MIHHLIDALFAWRECHKNWKKDKPPRPDELFKGAPKPSTVLVEMIAADLVKNLPDPKIKTEEDFKVKVSRTQTITTDWYTLNKVDRQHLYDREIYTNWYLISPAVSLTSHEKTILEKAWEQMSQLKAARAAAEREAQNQNNALKAIEKRLKIDTQKAAA
jgi:hypothetical protein